MNHSIDLNETRSCKSCRLGASLHGDSGSADCRRIAQSLALRRSTGGLHLRLALCRVGITYRYAMWLQRPPTTLYWKRGWQVFFRRRHFIANVGAWIKRVTNDFALNGFVWKRDPLRG